MTWHRFQIFPFCYNRSTSDELEIIELATARTQAALMPHVFIPPLLRHITDGVGEIDIEASTVRQIINAIDLQFPGFRDRLCEGDHLKPGLTVAVDGNVSSLGLLQKVKPESEVHFLPGVGGG